MLKKIIKKILRPQRKEEPSVNPDCSEFEINNWEISRFIQARLIGRAGIHPYPLAELTLMAGAVVRFRPTHIFEWGNAYRKISPDFL